MQLLAEKGSSRNDLTAGLYSFPVAHCSAKKGIRAASIAGSADAIRDNYWPGVSPDPYFLLVQMLSRGQDYPLTSYKAASHLLIPVCGFRNVESGIWNRQAQSTPNKLKLNTSTRSGKS